MFSNASLFDSFNTVTNPYTFEIDGVSFFGKTTFYLYTIGTSGQNIDDVWQNSTLDSRLDIAEHTLKWAHVAPTCPDTLWGYPYKSKDPLVLEEAPRIYFVGNQPGFEMRIVEGDWGRTVIVLLPKFEQTGDFVMVNTRTLETKCVNVDVGELDA